MSIVQLGIYGHDRRLIGMSDAPTAAWPPLQLPSRPGWLVPCRPAASSLDPEKCGASLGLSSKAHPARGAMLLHILASASYDDQGYDL